jgi:diaminohydroxyphosphoribosylaminopyrimidine deaminase/5-amino-6-(5-phosphoribosylamino)uracil reductase
MFHPEPPIIDPEWARFVDAARGAGPPPQPGPLTELFGPLLQPAPEGRPFVVAHLAQSLDGSIATASGGSQWISSDADLLHTHRLRSLCDAVLVGARTVEADDPMLTVRRCAGPSPLRVVLDPQARLDKLHRVFDGALRTIVISAVEAPSPGMAERWVLPSDQGVIAPQQILEVLHRAGIRRLLIEGGGLTVARFLQARLVDRLHLTIAPVLIGGGRPSLPIPLADSLVGSPRPSARILPLGPDWLVDCDLRG